MTVAADLNEPRTARFVDGRCEMIFWHGMLQHLAFDFPPTEGCSAVVALGDLDAFALAAVQVATDEIVVGQWTLLDCCSSAAAAAAAGKHELVASAPSVNFAERLAGYQPVAVAGTPAGGAVLAADGAACGAAGHPDSSVVAEQPWPLTRCHDKRQSRSSCDVQGPLGLAKG